MYSSFLKQESGIKLPKGIDDEGGCQPKPNQCNWLGLKMPALPFKPLGVTLAADFMLAQCQSKNCA